MDIYDQFLERLEQAVERAGNLKRLANITGINYPTLFRWSKREAIPNFETIRPLLPYLKNLDLLDIGDEEDKTTIQDIVRHTSPESIDPGTSVRVPVMGEVGAGMAVELWEQEPVDYISIMPEYIKEDLRVFRVTGDSMAPTIKRGAYVGVTPISNFQLTEGQIYLCYQPPFGLLVKRVRPASTHSVMLLSDNPDYQPIEIELGECEKIVLGEVRWVMQKV